MATYYSPSGNPLAQTRGTSPNIRAEFGLIQAGFTAVNVDMLLRAPLLSPAMTGTPTAPTAAAGSNTTQLATTAFVAAAGLSGSLPGQLGKDGNVIATDGATASWSTSLKSTVMRWADGTDATKKLAFGLSGLTTATTRTATWPDKDGTVAMMSDTALKLLATLTPTAAANVDALSVFTSAYDSYVIVGQGIKPASDGTLYLRFANAGVVDTASNYLTNTGGTTAGATTMAAQMSGTATTAAGAGQNFCLTVINANGTTTLKSMNGSHSSQSAATPAYDMLLQESIYAGTSAISGIRFYWNGGQNFAAGGTIRIFGRAN